MVWDSIHGQDFQAPPAWANVLLATAKRSLPDSELGSNDSQKKSGNVSLTFVVRMKPVEIANYYCPERSRRSKGRRRIPLRLWLTSGWPEVAGVIGTRWKNVL
jgi:hypothetical protein